MDSFHPGKKSLIFALLVAFLTTRNGRNLAAEIIHHHIKRRLVFLAPLQVRCNVVKAILSMPARKGNKVMGNATKPWGEQWDYITRIQKSSWYGHWIVRNSYQQKKNKRVQWLESTAATEADMVIYYIHGGGFRMGDSLMYMESFTHIIEHLRKARGLNVRIFSVDYAKTFENNYARSKEDCLNGYRYLVQDLKIDPKKIVFAGDSAGGNLVAETVLAIRDLKSADLPLPAANVQISPWANIENSQSTRPGKKYLDCLTFEMLATDHGEYFLKKGTYSNEEEKKIALRDPSISPVFASFTGICPTLVTYGGTEIFQHDCEELIQALKRDHVKVDVITRPNAPHIWLISSILSPTHKLWKEDCTRLAEWCANQVSSA